MEQQKKNSLLTLADAIGHIDEGNVSGEGAEKLFSMVDKDGSGTIDRAEFDRVYGAIKAQIQAEHSVEQQLQANVNQQKKRVKLAGCLIMVMGAFLAASVAATSAAMFAIIDLTKEVKVDPSGGEKVLADKSGNLIATAAEPLKPVGPVNPDWTNKTFEGVKTLDFNLPVANAPGMKQTLHLVVDGFTSVQCVPTEGACSAADNTVTFFTRETDVTFYKDASAPGGISYAWINPTGSVATALTSAGAEDAAQSRELQAKPENHPARKLQAMHPHGRVMFNPLLYCMINPVFCSAIGGGIARMILPM